MRNYYVYMITNTHNTVLYTGVSNDLERRLYEHRHKLTRGFSARYNLHKLVYAEATADVNAAISREKQIKGWVRARKNALVNESNPLWLDLSADWSSAGGDSSLRRRGILRCAQDDTLMLNDTLDLNDARDLSDTPF